MAGIQNEMDDETTAYTEIYKQIRLNIIDRI